MIYVNPMLVVLKTEDPTPDEGLGPSVGVGL